MATWSEKEVDFARCGCSATGSLTSRKQPHKRHVLVDCRGSGCGFASRGRQLWAHPVLSTERECRSEDRCPLHHRGDNSPLSLNLLRSHGLGLFTHIPPGNITTRTPEVSGMYAGEGRPFVPLNLPLGAHLSGAHASSHCVQLPSSRRGTFNSLSKERKQ